VDSMCTSTTAHAADLGDNERAVSSREKSSAFPRRCARRYSTRGVRCASTWSRKLRTHARTCVNPHVDSRADGAHTDEQKLVRDPVQILGLNRMAMSTIRAGVMPSVESTIHKEPRKEPPLGANERNGDPRAEVSPAGENHVNAHACTCSNKVKFRG